ncbi:unnamed protein product [Cyclocybe aegerita]|uniref:Las1-domain-containing protein n=1 Tax=Cyclocybe aegerita TaxID=1973307 RepID=A0A8S0W2N8_CYCAE|nr:unnamed protein product [Cyclocybe aegerita]
MRLPRRVPWASLAELDQVCAAIYGDENDVDAKIFAINRIAAWKAVTALPHAVESTLAFLVVIIEDTKQGATPPILLRHSYAAAVIRLVNGLVDPLQVGTYARSISAIAQQLGLPNWLVELRHAATHEDLPSLSLLQEAARQSMSWLLHNYYLPILNPVSTRLTTSAPPLRPLAPMLKFYKNTMKSITRDVSLMSQLKPKIVGILRDLERWIAECRVTANVAVGEVGWYAGQTDGADTDAKETWALERFCDGLAEKGMLVPLSKKKRQLAGEDLLPNKSSVAFWDPLLQHVQTIHVDFPYVLCRRLVSTLLTANTSPEAPTTDASYDMFLASWVIWTIETWQDTSSVYLDLKWETVVHLMKGLGCESPLASRNRSAISALLKNLTSGQEELESVTSLLLRPNTQLSGPEWNPSDLHVMEERNKLLQLTMLEPLSNSKQSNSSPQESSQDIAIPGCL